MAWKMTRPDYQAENDTEQEQFSNDENEDDEVNIDELIRSLEDSEPDPSPSTSAVLTGSQPTQSEGRPRKPQKLNLRWKKKNLQIFLILYPRDLFDFIATQTNLYIVQKETHNSLRLSTTQIQ
ncbi:hypothetical protein HHI36_012010 [Cryptolaemus montrouzieri]|uniref:Uncharacterized protein n=1 Tax=Cryptolaemus montrouzieri TaxID=559131 RepID=A0ABD2NDD4_9CUCU